MSLAASTHTLANGLTIVTLPRRTAPLGTFWIWYRVGGRNETPGITGISHWVEHMLFKGTEQFGKGEIFRSVTANGGMLNGFTWLDYTAYYETLPIDRIDLALRIESDRMVNARFDPAEFESERTVIIAEKQGSDNQPTTLLREEVTAAAFRAHPYGQGVIGYLSDLEAMQRDDLYSYYRMYYQPGNAVAVFAGDLEASDAVERIAAAFGDIPPGPPVPAVRTVEPQQYGERRVTVVRPAPSRVVQVVYKSPPASHPDTAALMVADAILSGGKSIGAGGGAGMGRSSRLYRRLVASGLVAAAGSSFGLTIDPYLFGLSATLKPESDSTQVEEILHAEIERLSTEPAPKDELERAQKQLRAQEAYATESAAGAASLLGALAMVSPGESAESFSSRVAAVTAEDIMEAAQRWLRPANRTVGWLIPEESGSTPHSSIPSSVLVPPAGYVPDAADLGLEHNMPVVRSTRLKNGLTVATLQPNPAASSRAVSVRLRVPGGSVVERAAHGVAAFTAAMLTRGSAGHTMDDIAEALDGLGASLATSAGREWTEIVGKSLREDAPVLLAYLADAVLRPDFPEDQIEIVRGQTLTNLRQAAQDTRAESERALRELLFPVGHPYRERITGTEASVGAMSREMLQEHHQAAIRPGGAIIAVAGGLTHDEAVAYVEAALSNWVGAAPEFDTAPPRAPERALREYRGLPGKVQADIAAGTIAVPRSHPDYYALNMANLIFGRLGLMGRLGESIRDRQGMAYYAYSSLESGLMLGTWSARAGVNPANVERAVETLREELRMFLEDGPTEREMADAVGNVTGSLPLGLETPDSVARVAADIVSFNLGDDYLQRFPSIVRGLTAAEITEVMARYIDPARLAIGIAGPPGDEAQNGWHNRQ
ncbi:MAG: insulinase family protein [Chloroflexi bacterium]|nr:MAG: insulinase family protein [Chloroflexota bacterium]